jgi:hypothetical protein
MAWHTNRAMSLPATVRRASRPRRLTSPRAVAWSGKAGSPSSNWADTASRSRAANAAARIAPVVADDQGRALEQRYQGVEVLVDRVRGVARLGRAAEAQEIGCYPGNPRHLVRQPVPVAARGAQAMKGKHAFPFSPTPDAEWWGTHPGLTRSRSRTTR